MQARPTSNFSLNQAPLVFITGASSGLGQALATYYALKGWRLALVARRLELMEQWKASQKLSNEQCQLYTCDVSQPNHILDVANRCLNELGLSQVVIACAGISHGVNTNCWDDLQAMQCIWNTNMLGLAATFLPFVKAMRQRGRGTLVGIASVAGIRGLPGHAAYCSSKAGVIAYCESLRGDLVGSGVKVVTISPGFVDTPMTKSNPFPMPFLISAHDFARQAFKVIEKQKSYAVIPWQMACAAKLLRLLPNWLFDRLFANQPRKPNKPH